MLLPQDFIPDSEWITVTPEVRRSYFYPKIIKAFSATVAGPAWRPKTVQLGGKLLAIDYCRHPVGKKYDANGNAVDHSHPHSYRVAVVDDHPFLRKLPKNAPRSVKTMFTAETRMRWLRVWDGWQFYEASTRANEDWADFIQKSRAP